MMEYKLRILLNATQTTSTLTPVAQRTSLYRLGLSGKEKVRAHKKLTQSLFLNRPLILTSTYFFSIKISFGEAHIFGEPYLSIERVK